MISVFILVVLGSFVESIKLSQTVGKSRKVNLHNLLDLQLPYDQVWKFQQHLVDQQIQCQESEHLSCAGSLVLLQHKPVYTLGTGTEAGSGPFSQICADGTVLEYETFNVERAGQATFHGPGQIVMYPILDLGYFEKDINIYLRGLEQIVVDTCQDLGISAGRVQGQTGVWVGSNFKIAAIGIKIRRWVTMHGISVNVNPDMRYFSNIVPCGISDREVGTIKQFNSAVTLPQGDEPFLFPPCCHARFLLRQ